MTGIGIPSYTAPFTPCVEVGWRLGRRYWGQGFATEAARAVLEFGFETVDLPEIVALTVPSNARSRAVMARLGMTRTASDDFDHPLVPDGHELKRHVLYRFSKQAWLRTHLPRLAGSDEVAKGRVRPQALRVLSSGV